MMNEAPHWVRARADCTPDFVFKALRELVWRDVAEANEIPPAKRFRRTFRAETITGGPHPMFRVQRSPDDASIFFHLRSTEIHVAHGNNELLFAVTPEWNAEESRCDLFVDGVQCELWQISKKALSDLFFRP